MRGSHLDADEDHEQHRRDREVPERRDREPVVLVRLDERVDEQGERGRDDDRARGVEVAHGVLDAALVEQARRQRDRDQADRDVDVEDPLPAEVLGEDPAEQHADRAACAGDRAPDREGLVALDALGERGREDRERRRRDDRRAEPLHGARADEHAARAREAAGERGCHEQQEPDHEHQTTAEQVGHAASEEQEAAEGQGVAARHPLQVRGREVQGTLDRRQRNVDDRDVDHQHELRGAEEAERDPAAGVRRRGGHGSLQRSARQGYFLGVIRAEVPAPAPAGTERRAHA